MKVALHESCVFMETSDENLCMLVKRQGELVMDLYQAFFYLWYR